MKISLDTSPRSLISILVILPVMAIMPVLVSCTVNKKNNTTGSHVSQQAVRYTKKDEIENRILREYGQWRGTRHSMGGTGGKGIDCSGFVQKVYLDAFNIDLPRTTKEQVKQGKPVSFGELQAGDLVFFKPPGYPRHVGIFLSKSEFVHASKNKGVTVSRIDAQYWGKYYWTSRRILPKR